MFHKILVAIDGSDPGDRALAVAADLAARYGAALDIVHVRMHGRPVEELQRMAEVEHIVSHVAPRAIPTAAPNILTMSDLFASAEHEARVVAEIGDRLLEAAERRAQEAGAGRVKTHSLGGDYADGILDAAKDSGADLVVMGRRGLGRLRRLVAGSVSNSVVQRAECAVLLIH